MHARDAIPDGEDAPESGLVWPMRQTFFPFQHSRIFEILGILILFKLQFLAVETKTAHPQHWVTDSPRAIITTTSFNIPTEHYFEVPNLA
jgi:hypothetical protein